MYRLAQTRSFAHFLRRACITAGLLCLAAPGWAAVFTFDGGAGTADPPRDPANWFDAANWSPDGVPGPDDTVVVGDQSARLDGDLTVANLTFQGSLSGIGTLTVTNSVEWRGGLLSGTLVIPQGSTLSLPTGICNVDGRGGGGIINNAGTLNIGPFASLRFFGGNKTALLNSGTLIGTMQEGTSSSFLEWDTAGEPNELPTLLQNTGTLRTTGPATGHRPINTMRVENSGTIEAHGGALELSQSSLKNSGPLDVAADATLDFGAETPVQFDPGSLVTGLGKVRVTGTWATLNGNLPIGVAPIGDGPGKPGRFEIFGGGMLGNLTVNTAPDGIAVWSGGVIAGTLNVPVGSRLLLGPPERPNSGLPLDGRQGAGVINNSGEMVLTTAASIQGFGGSGPAINNGGTFEIQIGDGYERSTIATNETPGEGSLILRNTGLLKNTGGNGRNALNGLRMENSGQIDVQNGSVGISGSALDNTGTFAIAEGSQVEFYATSTVTFGGGSRIVGTGRARVASSPATLTGSVTLGSADTPAGTFELASPGMLKGDLTLAAVGQGQAVWSGGTLAGALHIAPGTPLRLGAADHRLDGAFGGALLDNMGVATLEPGGTIGAANGTTEVRNGGDFEMQTGSGSGRTTLDWSPTGGGTPLAIHNLGTGQFRRTGGSDSLLFNGVNVTNHGLLALERGEIELRGGFDQSGTGSLVFGVGDLTPGDGFARLKVVGPASLSGGVRARPTGNFAPKDGDAFGALDYDTRTGQFDTVGLEGREGFTAEALYGEKDMTLTVKALRGDNNADNSVDINDAVAALKTIVGLSDPTSSQRSAMDLNGDGQVNIIDVIFILKIVVGIE